EQNRSQAEDTIELNTWAMQWWESQLKSGDGQSQQATQYLKNRGITSETCLTFHLGYAPDSWDGLSGFLRQRGASNLQIEQSGLVVRKETGGFYDRFRGRLIFPVMDANGRVIAFGGRTMSADGEPKYLNSPETPSYRKGHHLYGLNLSRDQIRRQKHAILVEGYFDLIMPCQFGVRNIVASLGTALTSDQVRLLGRYARQVVINYDGDKAGLEAARRALEVLSQEEFEAKVLVLPGGTDPDEFVRANGMEAYRDLRQKAASSLQFIFNRAVEGKNLHRPEEKTAAVMEVVSFLRSIKSRLLRRESFDICMNDLKVDDPSVRRDLWQAAQRETNGTIATSYTSQSVSRNEAVARKAALASSVQPTVAELRLLELLINRADVRRSIIQLLREDDFKLLPTAPIFRAVNKLEDAGVKDFAYEELKNLLADAPEALELLPRLLIASHETDEKETDKLEDEARRCSIALKLMSYDHRLNEFGAEIAAAERTGDQELCSR
ncbi:MAG: DNA primase, partial [Pyrinomonadaceae bacterium]